MEEPAGPQARHSGDLEMARRQGQRGGLPETVLAQSEDDARWHRETFLILVIILLI